MIKINALAATFGIILALSVHPVAAQNAAPATAAPDDTRTNIRDRNASEFTADQAGNEKSDREIMANIRKSIVADKSLSTYAQNIKIISTNGKVTLKGPVRSDSEVKAIQDKAAQVAGPNNVTSELSVKTDQ